MDKVGFWQDLGAAIMPHDLKPKGEQQQSPGGA